MMVPNYSGGAAASRWIDGSVSIADGRVLATPVESDWLYCLSLIDGKELWKSPRQNDLYVAGADREKVVLVGPRAVRALRMADGQPAWDGRTVELPEGSTPSGRGFLTGDRYFLPLSSAEVVAIDLAAGKIVQTAKSRKGNTPGNLVCYRGKVISQGLDGVEAYYQLEAVEAETAAAIGRQPRRCRGPVAARRDLVECRQAVGSRGLVPPRVRVGGQPANPRIAPRRALGGLRTEFAAYRDRSGEVERLLDDPSQRATYLRLMADGLRQEGQWMRAFEFYQKLIDLEPDRRPLDQVSKTLSVRRDRWFQGQLALLRNEANARRRRRLTRRSRRG